MALMVSSVPPYLQRAGFKPTNPYDFGDGGAFPEIGYAQYPLCMGSNKQRISCVKTLPLAVDDHGSIIYDSIVKQNENAKIIIYTKYLDLIPSVAKDNEDSEEIDVDEKEKEIEATTIETKAALEKRVGFKLLAEQPTKVQTQSSDSKFVRYKPSQRSASFNSGAKERIVRVVEIPVDALEPPKFKHKKILKASGSPPVPVLRSPPRPVTVKDQQDWKIPPCISNWKNSKGYIIPLHDRLAADGGVLQDVRISDNFRELSETLYVAEQKAREAVALRSNVEKERMMREKEKNEMELRELARKARFEKGGVREVGKETKEEREERLARERIREERCRERKRERMVEVKDGATGKKMKVTRDRGRDISEKVALGMGTSGGRGGEVMYDQRLFNQEKGMDSGFAVDDAYYIYDRGLFTVSSMGNLYKPKKDKDEEMYGGEDEQLENLRKSTKRFKSGTAFMGASERMDHSERPTEFEKDIFGLDKFLTDLNSGKKKNKD